MKITKSQLKQIIKEELEKVLSEQDLDGNADDAEELRDIADDLAGVDAEEISADEMRRVREEDKKSFHNNTPEDVQAVKSAALNKNMVNYMNPKAVQAASDKASADDVLFLGVSPQHIYFKTMDEKYYRIPRGGGGDDMSGMYL